MNNRVVSSRTRRNIIDFVKNFLIVSFIFGVSTITVSGMWNLDGISNAIFENTIFVVSVQDTDGITENTELPELRHVKNEPVNPTPEATPAVAVSPSPDTGTGSDGTANDNNPGGSGEASHGGPKLTYMAYIVYDINEIPGEGQFLRDIGAYAEGYPVTSNYNSINKSSAGVYSITITASNNNGTSSASVKVNITDENTEIFYGN